VPGLAAAPCRAAQAAPSSPASAPAACCSVHGQAYPFSDPAAHKRILEEIIYARWREGEQVLHPFGALPPCAIIRLRCVWIACHMGPSFLAPHDNTSPNVMFPT
jgi:hypothetical protein